MNTYFRVCSNWGEYYKVLEFFPYIINRGVGIIGGLEKFYENENILKELFFTVNQAKSSIY